VTLQVIASTAVSFAPYLPSSSRAVLEALGVDVGPDGPTWRAPDVVPGSTLTELGPLFPKVELEPEE
jgi:methionyl-tRNA synthetase